MFDFRKNKKSEPPDSGNIVFDKLEANANLTEEPATIHTMKDDLDAAKGITLDEKKVEPESIPEEKTPVVDMPEPPLPPDRNAPEKLPVEESPVIELAPQEKPQKKAADQKSYSPFLNTAPPQQPTYEPKEPKKEVKKSPKKPIKWGKILFMIVIFIVIVASLGAGYYFWMTRQTAVVPPIDEPPVIDEPIVIDEPQSKYSIDNPNYLSIDSESSTSSSIQELLSTTATEIVNEKITKPVEFIITDTDNDPVAFSIFSILYGLDLSSVLDSLDEEFSLFIYPDSLNNRVGLAVNIKDATSIKTAMTAKEKTLIKDLSPLYLGIAPNPITQTFSDSTYKNVEIRYVNINPSETLSVDYTISETQLIIGTSKNTLRAIIDKLNIGNNQAGTNETDKAATDTATDTTSTTSDDSTASDTNTDTGAVDQSLDSSTESSVDNL